MPTFLRQVKWCGRIIDGEGVQLDPSRLQTLLQMPHPQSGAELQKFVCASNWMRSAVPEYTTLISPLSNLLNAVCKKVGKNNRKAVSKIPLLDCGWSQEHSGAFEAVKSALGNAVRLAHPSSEKTFCLFTDASDLH